MPVNQLPITKASANSLGVETMRHFEIELRWIHPTRVSPWFWINDVLTMRYQLDGDEQAAISAVRRTWTEEEAKVTSIKEMT